jgi:hypothetical protein
MKEAVHTLTVRRPGGQSGKGISIDGEVTEIIFRDLNPQHDPTLGTYYTDANGTRWKPVHGMRLAANGEYAGGPGWFELLDPAEEAPEDE